VGYKSLMSPGFMDYKRGLLRLTMCSLTIDADIQLLYSVVQGIGVNIKYFSGAAFSRDSALGLI